MKAGEDGTKEAEEEEGMGREVAGERGARGVGGSSDRITTNR